MADVPFEMMPPEPTLSPPAPPPQPSDPLRDVDATEIVSLPAYYRPIVSFKQLCPPGICVKKVAIGVFNGVLRASMKLLVHAVQDGRTFGEEIHLFCRGFEEKHDGSCFCKGAPEDVDSMRTQFLDCASAYDGQDEP